MRKRLFLFALALFLSSLSISGQNNPSYPEIRQALDAKNLWLAKKELNKVFPENPNDPALTFYQAEIWIQEGEIEYIKGNFRNAWEYYSKAHEVWPSHPIVRRRYEELRGKKLVNNSIPVNENNESNPQKPKKVAVGIPWMFGLTGAFDKKNAESENTITYSEPMPPVETNLSFKDLLPTKELDSVHGLEKEGKLIPPNDSDRKIFSGTKIVYISDSSNLEEVKSILSEMNQDLKLIKNSANMKDSILQVDSNSVILSRNFVFNTLGIFGIIIISLIFFVFRLNTSVNELKRKKSVN